MVTGIATWHCHLCDEAFSHVDELCRIDRILIARRGDPCHPDDAALLRSYVQLQERAVMEYRSMLAAEDDYDLEAAPQRTRECVETVFRPDMPKSLKRKFARKQPIYAYIQCGRTGWLCLHNFARVTDCGLLFRQLSFGGA